jgi:hypothetical protein
VPVSAGCADKAAVRVSAQLEQAGFDDAMTAAIRAEEVLSADETPVSVLGETVLQPAAREENEEGSSRRKRARPGAARAAAR